MALLNYIRMRMDMEREVHNIEIHVEMTPVVNYALQQDRLPVIREVILQNSAETELANAILRSWSKPQIDCCSCSPVMCL